MLTLLGRAVDLAHRTGLVRPVRVAGVRVISVGALTLGGAGKTPVAMAIAEAARDAGLPTAVVLRGYRGLCERTGALVSDGERLLTSVVEAGDEAVLHARRLPGVLVRIGADRVEAVRRARHDGARLVVLDDGFQHRRLARDLDVVCLAPGLRRETDAALERADLLVTVGEAPGARTPGERPALSSRLEDWSPFPAPARTIDAPLVAAGIVRGPELVPFADVGMLRGANVALACAIARPERFVRLVERLGARVVSLRARRDHSTLDPRDLQTPRGADLLLVTEKDAVKLDRGVLALRVRVEVPSAAAPPRSP
ncbi:MAG: tetraacyldisaccharide 4'-kinase [Deltaproteobacteria bacterium]|nr:tetraacyldisaccharide 4'-kinase [Deltaproteobacteria bacterium]